MDGGGSAPPGWYVDPGGLWRWWDGAAWGPVAPPPQPSNTMAIFAHVGMLLSGFIVPLVLYLVADDRDRWTKSHCAEALDMSITFLIAVIGGFIVGIVLSVAVSFAFIVVVYVGFFAAYVVHIVWGIKAAVRAGRYQEWRYPVRIPFVRSGF